MPELYRSICRFLRKMYQESFPSLLFSNVTGISCGKLLLLQFQLQIFLQVPLGVLFKSEMSHEDMISIMTHLQTYVPKDTQEDEVSHPVTNEKFKVSIDSFHHILFGGDQLTVERVERKREVTKPGDRRDLMD